MGVLSLVEQREAAAAATEAAAAAAEAPFAEGEGGKDRADLEDRAVRRAAPGPRSSRNGVGVSNASAGGTVPRRMRRKRRRERAEPALAQAGSSRRRDESSGAF